MQIIKPTMNDIPNLLPLWKEQYRLHHELDPEYYQASTPQTMDKINRHLQSLINRPEASILVAKEDGQIVGFITFQENREPYLDEKIQRYVEVEELFVSEDYRKLGVGKKLVQSMERELAKLGIFYTQLGCAINNQDGLAFYRKVGYRDNHLWFIKKSDIHS